MQHGGVYLSFPVALQLNFGPVLVVEAVLLLVFVISLEILDHLSVEKAEIWEIAEVIFAAGDAKEVIFVVENALIQ